MVLKIRGYGSYDWWVYGGVRRVHYKVVDKAEHMEVDYDLKLFLEKVDEVEKKCLRIVLRLVNGDEFGILTDSTAYLCNDSGETIEKIVV